MPAPMTRKPLGHATRDFNSQNLEARSPPFKCNNMNRDLPRRPLGPVNRNFNENHHQGADPSPKKPPMSSLHTSVRFDPFSAPKSPYRSPQGAKGVTSPGKPPAKNIVSLCTLSRTSRAPLAPGQARPTPLEGHQPMLSEVQDLLVTLDLMLTEPETPPRTRVTQVECELFPAPTKPDLASIKSKPAAAPTEVDFAPTEPEAAPTEPEVAPTEPEAAPTEPEASGPVPTESDLVPAEPGATPTKPGSGPAEPSSDPNESDPAPTEAAVPTTPPPLKRASVDQTEVREVTPSRLVTPTKSRTNSNASTPAHLFRTPGVESRTDVSVNFAEFDVTSNDSSPSSYNGSDASSLGSDALSNRSVALSDCSVGKDCIKTDRKTIISDALVALEDSEEAYRKMRLRIVERPRCKPCHGAECTIM